MVHSDQSRLKWIISFSVVDSTSKTKQMSNKTFIRSHVTISKIKSSEDCYDIGTKQQHLK